MAASLSFVKFHALDKMYLNRDYQIHTRWTDGQHTPAEIIEAAQKAGLSSIAFTEHIRRESTYFSDFFIELDALRRQSPMQIFIGVETKVIDEQGHLDISNRDFDLAEIVLGSVHRIPHEGRLVHPRELGKEKTLEKEFRYSLAMIEDGAIDVLAHPLGMSLRIHDDFSREDLEALIKRMAATTIAFEINAKYTNTVFFKTVIELCQKYDPYISIGSDVHQINELGNSKRMLEAVL